MGDYNGWSNKETWCVGLWLMDMFREMASDQVYTVEELEKVLEDVTWEHLELEGEGSLLLDIVTTYLHAVNWKELAEAALEN